MRRLLIALLVCALVGPAAAAVRIKDITALRGARDSQLIGYGLVIGLAGTGDSLRSAPFTQQALSAMLDRMGINVRGSQLANRNVAAVIVTADLPAGMDVGSRLDVTVSALGDSSSLMGGTLLLTQLSASDGFVYADAQGAVSVTGFDVAGQAQKLVTELHPRHRHAGLHRFFDHAGLLFCATEPNFIVRADAHQGRFFAQDAVGEFNRRFEILVFARGPVEFAQTLEARHHFVGFRRAHLGRVLPRQSIFHQPHATGQAF